MSIRVRRRTGCFPQIAKAATFRLKWLDSHAPSTDLDRETLTIAKEWFERQLRWSFGSMVFGVVLGTAAIAVAVVLAGPLVRGTLLVAGLLDLTVAPFYTLMACWRYQRMIELISLDLENGVVGLGEGRVRRLFGIWRSVLDLSTHRARVTLAACFDPRSLRPGSVVSYRYALRSALVIGVEHPTSPTAEGR